MKTHLKAVTMILPILLLGGCVFPMGSTVAMTGSGNTKTVTRQLAAFVKIEAGGAIQIEFTQGPARPVEVSADDNLLPKITTEVKGDTLHIHSEGNISTKTPIKVKVSSPELTRIELNGASQFQSGTLLAPTLDVEANGASAITISRLASDTFSARLTGASQSNVGGTAKRAKIKATGASTAIGPNVIDGTFDASGASKIKASVSGSLDAAASGASSIRYKGNPRLKRKSASGSSTIAPSER